MNRTGPAALTLGALLLLASCSGEDADAEPTPAASSSSPTATASSPAPSETPPPMPAQANAPFPEGAPAFTKYYVDVLNHAARTGDTGTLARLSDDACSGCRNYVEDFTGKRLDRSDELWEIGTTADLQDTGAGTAVTVPIGALRDDGSRDPYSMVFVVSEDEPRRILDLYLLED